MKKVMFVCHGNICRSPMAEFIMKSLCEKKKLDIVIDSTATSTEEIGNDIYYKAKRVLDNHGIKYQRREARRFTIDDYNEYDYVIIMDSYNYHNILRIVGNDRDNKIKKLLSFCGSDNDISDPWYSDKFEECYQEILDGCNSLCDELQKITK